MGDATEALAEYLGPTLGGLLNATLGNAPEIIISLFALNRGLIGIVKSSLTGSIIGNLLFGLGASMIAGGLKVREQKFDSNVARINGALLVLASFGLIIPAIYRNGKSAGGRAQPAGLAGDRGDPVPGVSGEPGLHAGDQQGRRGQGRRAGREGGGRRRELEAVKTEEKVGWSRNKAIGDPGRGHDRPGDHERGPHRRG